MSNNGICKLCRYSLTVNVDLKVLLDESTISKLLKTLFKCYNIDVSILEKSSSICKKCNEGVSQICESLKKWSKAQEVLRAIPLDIDDSKAFLVNFKPEPEPPFSEIQNEEPLRTDDDIFIKEEEPETDDVKFLEDSGPPLSESHEEALRTPDVIFIKGEEPETDDIDFLDDEGPPLSEIRVEPLDAVDAIFIEKKEPETDDEDLVEEIISEDSDGGMPIEVSESDWRSSLQNFFCVCLGPDGLALTILFKDNTTERNIRMLCTCCNQLFATMSDIQKHASITRPNPEYWCGVCNIIYPSSFELNIHEKLRRHFRPKTCSMVMRCLKCGKMSKQLSDAIKHENDLHEKFVYVCSKCKVSFKCRFSYDSHQERHETYVCNYMNCQKRFRLCSRYASHLEWHKNRRSGGHIESSNVAMESRNHDQPLAKPRKILRLGRNLTSEIEIKVRDRTFLFN